MIKNITSFGARVAALVAVQFVAYVAASGVVSAAGLALPAPKDQSLAAQMLLLTCLVNAIIIGLLLRRSEIHGIRLVGLVFSIIYGIQTVMSQLETLYFNSVLGIPGRGLLGIIASGAVTALMTSIGAVLLFGRRRSGVDTATPKWQQLPVRQWALLLSLLSVTYVVLYFVFGYYVAWQFTDVRTFYSHSIDMLSFPAHMLNVIRVDPWLPAFQALRGVLWVGLAMLILTITGGRAWTDALLTGGILGVLLTSQLLIPNPYMGDTVRMAHLLETSTSTFVFGVAIVWLVGFKSVREAELS